MLREGGQMNYPTIEQVEAADHEQICRWYRFLPSPGRSAIDRDEPYEVFNRLLKVEAVVMTRISDRLKDLGGFTPEISKRIGWTPE
jgi:hypothetical protein